MTTYSWDTQDQLIQITFPDTTTATYKYDGLGRRIEKNVNGFVTRYVYDGQDIVLEFSGSTNTFMAHYSHGDRVDQPLVVQRAGLGFFYYHSDHQGSITHLTDSSGTIANRYLYDSYGWVVTVTEAVPQPFTYTGRELDTESGLYYYRARYYDATTGRFLSEDPIGFSANDQNLYRYVFSNPVNFNDPSGEFVAVLAFPILGGVGFDVLAIGGALTGLAILSTGGDSASTQDGGASTQDGRTPNTQDPEGALESLEKAQDKAKTPENRPSVDDPSSEFDGMKRRPKQTKITSTEKSRQRAKNRRNSDFQCE